MENLKQFSLAFVTDLVSSGLMGKEVNGKWTLTHPILGYASDVTFHSRDELIQKISASAINSYGNQGGQTLRRAI